MHFLLTYKWMHLDEVQKWISTHQQWYKCLQEAIVLDHNGENPNMSYGQRLIIKHSLKPKSLTSTRCEGKATTLLIWKPKVCWNFAKNSFATSQDLLQKMTFCSNEKKLLFIKLVSLWTLSNSTYPRSARVWKASIRHSCAFTLALKITKASMSPTSVNAMTIAAHASFATSKLLLRSSNKF